MKVKMSENADRVIRKGRSFADIPNSDKTRLIDEVIAIAADLTAMVESQPDVKQLQLRIDELEKENKQVNDDVRNLLARGTDELAITADENTKLTSKINLVESEHNKLKREYSKMKKEVTECYDLLSEKNDEIEQLKLILNDYDETHNNLNGLGKWLAKQLGFDDIKKENKE